jgi:hypothetical protein
MQPNAHLRTKMSASYAACQIITPNSEAYDQAKASHLTSKIQKPYAMLLTHHQTGEDNLYANRGAF